MRALLLLSGLILASGCDDPEVTDRVASLLEHGGVQAKATCTGQNGGTCPFWDAALTFEFTKFADGALMVSAPIPAAVAGDVVGRSNVLRLCGRSEACAEPTVQVARNGYSGVMNQVQHFELADGQYTVYGDSSFVFDQCGVTPFILFTDAIGDACTGFNLEAFD